MRPAGRRGVALVVALLVIGLLGMWGLLWARSLTELRHRVVYERAYEAALDLASSAETRAIAALEAGRGPPDDAWVGLGGTARATVRALATDRYAIRAIGTLDGEGPIETLAISVEWVRGDAGWSRVGRQVAVALRPHGGG